MRRLATVVALAAASTLLPTIGSAAPAGTTNRGGSDRAAYTVTGGVAPGSAASAFAGDAQHGGAVGHLPGSSANVDLVGRLEPTSPFGPVVEGQIADVAVFKSFAYLNSWNEATCSKGGVYVADIRNPTKPSQVSFIPALPKNYHGEGAQGISVANRTFTGDVLAVNNETCGDTTVGGGFDLYDVTDPRTPRVLVQGFGDTGAEGRLSGPGTKAREYHSVFMWNDDGKTYLVASDDEELHDVDIFDISDPRRPKPVAEYDLAAKFPQILETPAPHDNLVLNHDMVVKEIDGRDVLLESYWDAGYVLIDIEDPAKPKYIGDSDFGTADPLMPGLSPEGNAHQAEFSFDNQYVLAADVIG